MDPNTSPGRRHPHNQMASNPQYTDYQQPGAHQYPYGSSQPTGNYGGYAQPQPLQQPPSFTDTGASFFGGGALPTAQIGLGLHLGNQAFAVGQDYMNKNIDKLVPKQKLKAYFNVTNTYVFQKLLLLAFPFRHKTWQRLMASTTVDGHSEAYAPPRDDINAPDLYIPMMAFVTYVLLIGLTTGLQSKFHPKVLGETATMVAILTFFEWGAIKLGLYLLNIGVDLSSLDILSLIGYNYVGLIAAVSAGIFFGAYGKWAAYAYSCVTMFFFVMRSLRQIFLPDAAEALVITQRRRRVNFLFGIFCFQAAVSFLALIFK